MVAELLRGPPGAAWAAERRDGGGNGLADLAGAGFIGTLQRRREHRVGQVGADAWVVTVPTAGSGTKRWKTTP
jgi:hypothetical protein